MASRAPTLVKPKPVAKPKPKATATKLAVKSSSTSTKSSSVSKSALKPPTLKSSESKVSLAQARTVKAGVSTAPVSKSKMLKSVPTKASAAKAAKLIPTAAAKPKIAVVETSVAIAGAASFETAAPKPRRRAKGEIRTRIYWAVFNQSLRRVAVFEFDQRDEAEKRAARLAKASGEHHFLQKIKAIVQ